MNKRVLLVGIQYHGQGIEGVVIENRGLANQEIGQLYAAAALFEYDVIVIYPKSYSHFIFGYETKHSNSRTELYDLKRDNNYHDFDSIFWYHERVSELQVAVQHGTRVIWLLTPDKLENFFGKRSLYMGYLNRLADQYIRSCTLYIKSASKLEIMESKFESYFSQLRNDGWNLCWYSAPQDNVKPIATSPEGFNLGVELIFDHRKYWMLTPPTSQTSIEKLVADACNLAKETDKTSKYHGIFLSHSSADKPFVRRLKETLHEKGVHQVWVDEAEILVGDSLIHKIEEGIKKTKYFGIVLSKNSISSRWVQNELEQAMMMEINHNNIKVLPLLLEKCELPAFLQAKRYADFTSEELYEQSVQELLRRLEKD
jgi:hypothetical protein